MVDLWRLVPWENARLRTFFYLETDPLRLCRIEDFFYGLVLDGDGSFKIVPDWENCFYSTWWRRILWDSAGLRTIVFTSETRPTRLQGWEHCLTDTISEPNFSGGCSLESMSVSNICLYEAVLTRQVHCKTSADTIMLSFQLKMLLEERALFSAGSPDLWALPGGWSLKTGAGARTFLLASSTSSYSYTYSYSYCGVAASPSCTA